MLASQSVPSAARSVPFETGKTYCVYAHYLPMHLLDEMITGKYDFILALSKDKDTAKRLKAEIESNPEEYLIPTGFQDCDIGISTLKCKPDIENFNIWYQYMHEKLGEEFATYPKLCRPVLAFDTIVDIASDGN
jgi:hypothetical protein